MKKLKNLSLHRRGQAQMTKKEMNTLTGGGGLCGCWYHCYCTCGCRYAGAQEGPNDSYYGGSSTEANNSANSNKSDNEYGQSVSQFNGDTGGYYIGYQSSIRKELSLQQHTCRERSYLLSTT